MLLFHPVPGSTIIPWILLFDFLESLGIVWYIIVKLLLLSCWVLLDSLWSHGLQHARLPCPSLSPGVCSNSSPLSWWCLQPCHPLSPSSPPALNLPQYQSLFQWVGSSHQVAKILELQLQQQSFYEYSGLISNRIDWFDLLAVQETLKSLL